MWQFTVWLLIFINTDKCLGDEVYFEIRNEAKIV